MILEKRNVWKAAKKRGSELKRPEFLGEFNVNSHSVAEI